MKDSYRILAEDRCVSNDTWATGLNNNDLIIGVSGAGKTRGYVKPNVLQCAGSLVITDTKGDLHGELGDVLERHGYAVRKLDLTDCLHSPWGYNPLRHIRYDRERGYFDEQDIMTVSTILTPVESAKDPFWDYLARMLAECLIGYALEYLPPEEMTLTSVGRLMTVMDGGFDSLMKEVEVMAPDSFTATRYKMLQSMCRADKMTASVRGILAEKLAPFMFPGAEAMFRNSNQMDFRELGRRRAAVFLCLSDTDSALDKLATMFYTQALQTLCLEAKRRPDGRLAVPVRIILDDFASSADTCIPNFDKLISVIRSRDISVSVILQSLSQLEASYGKARAMTIVNNCDNLLYLGGQDVETAQYIARKANKPVDAVLQMPLDGAWLFTRGEAPSRVAKYDLKSHPRYPELPEGRRRDGRAEPGRSDRTPER